MERTHKAERGTILALALVLLVVLSLLGLAMIQLAQFANTREHIQYRRAQAQWRVKGATEYAVWELCSTDAGSQNALREAPDYTYGWGADGEYLDFPLTSTASADGSLVDIEVSVDPDNPTLRAIRAETRVMDKGAVARHVIDTYPQNPALAYAILADGNLLLNGNVAVRSDPTSADVWNADIHGNGGLVQVWGSATVDGFATSAGEAIIKDGAVNPPVNPYGLPSYATYRAPVPVPDIDPESLRGMADVIVSPAAMPVPPKTGPAVLNYGGTEDDPTIVFVDGDWIPKGDYVFNDNVILVVNGAFAPISGGFSFGAAPGGHMSIIANSIDIEGNAQISAWMYGRDALSFDGRGGAILNGSITTKGAIDLAGTVDINYPRINDNFFPVSQAPRRLCYQTRSGGQTW